MKFNPLLAVLSIVVLNFSWGHDAHAGEKLDDATILAIFDQANTADIYIGRLGAKYGLSEDVRELGRMVATDHVAVQQMGRDLAKKLNIIPTPPDNDQSVIELKNTVLLLRSMMGAAFDEAYLRHEMDFHQSVISAVKQTLLPAAHNPEIKKLIEGVLPGLEHHLAETKAVARKLNVK